MLLTRTNLQAGLLQQMVLQSGLALQVLTETELQQSLCHTLRQSNLTSDVWLFAYGSLIWNPIFRFIERRVGTVYGLHRRFCLWAPLGRGTPNNPGLILGLDRGGSCRGIAYRIAATDLLPELLLVWRREMVVGSYIPRWAKVFDDTQEIEAITFVVNRNYPYYVGELSLETTINSIATSAGQLGSCADYLLQTVNGLMSVGIKDRHLLRLCNQVMARQRTLAVTIAQTGEDIQAVERT